MSKDGNTCTLKRWYFTLTIPWKKTSLNVAFIGQKRVLEKKNINDQRRKASYTICTIFIFRTVPLQYRSVSSVDKIGHGFFEKVNQFTCNRITYLWQTVWILHELSVVKRKITLESIVIVERICYAVKIILVFLICVGFENPILSIWEKTDTL